MNRKLALVAATAAFSVAAGACGGVPTKDNPTGLKSGAKTATVRVEAQSDLCWSGAIGNATREGCGDASFEVEGLSGIFTANAQKQPYLGQPGIPSDPAQLGSLREATSEPLTLVLEIGGKEVDRQTTTAKYGVVMVSNGK